VLHGRHKKQSSNGHIDYAEFSHSGHQIPASKNVLKTLFSKGELRIHAIHVSSSMDLWLSDMVLGPVAS